MSCREHHRLQSAVQMHLSWITSLRLLPQPLMAVQIPRGLLSLHATCIANCIPDELSVITDFRCSQREITFRHTCNTAYQKGHHRQLEMKEEAGSDLDVSAVYVFSCTVSTTRGRLCHKACALPHPMYCRNFSSNGRHTRDDHELQSTYIEIPCRTVRNVGENERCSLPHHA